MYILFDSSWIRATLRVYFVVALLLVAWLGDKCLHQRTKLKLLRGEQVQVTSMTGWLRGPIFMKTAMQMRRMPGGVLGFFMILSAVLALLSDLAVSGLVKTVFLQSRCRFKSGLRVDQQPSRYPSNVGTPALWATTAQAQSYINGGLLGIYHKADNSGNFSAELADVAGNWSCIPGQERQYNVPEWSDDAIAYDLVLQSILYENGIYGAQNWSVTGSNLSNQTVIMTVDAIGSSTDPRWSNIKTGLWNARFAVDIRDTQYVKHFRAYDCRLQDFTNDGIVTKVVADIDIGGYIMDDWLRSIQGKLWDDFDSPKPVADIGLYLSWMLNTMTMVAGATNRVTYQGRFDETLGCLRPYSTIPWPVLTCLAIATFLLLFFALYLLWLFAKVHRQSRIYDRNAIVTTPGGTPVPSSEIRLNTPNGLLDWMQHAVHESGNSEKPPRTHHLSRWLFSTRHHGGRRLGVVSKHMSRSTVGAYFAPQSSTSHLMSPPTPEGHGLSGSPSSNGSSYFPRRPVPSADYSSYHELREHDYDVGVTRIRSSL